MENNFYNTQKEQIGVINAEIPVVLCDEICYDDLTGDFTLPDYVPEVVRLMRVEVKPAPADCYLSGDAVKAACAVGYDVLYVGGDGHLHHTTLSSDCEFSSIVPTDLVWERSKGAEIQTDVSAESATCRVNGARKVSIRCRMMARIRAVGKRRASDEHGGAMTDVSVQKLYSTSSYSVESFGENRDITVNDDIGSLREGERLISTDCRVFVEQATAYDGYAECRGTIVMKHLIGGEDGELRAVSDKMSFSEVVEADGMRSGDTVAAYGRCFKVENGTGDDDSGDKASTVNASVYLKVRGFRNEEIRYLKDAYSTTNECHLQTEDRTLPTYSLLFNRNMTFSGSESIGNLQGISDRSVISDVFAEAYGGDVVLDESGHYIINGKCRFNVIASNADGEEEDGRQLEYTAWELELPFRFECSEEGDAIEGACLELECIGAVARFAGDKLELGCEIAMACGVFGEHQINEVCAISLGEPADQRKKGFTVCYIGEGDSLWSISKKYRARLDHTAEENGISPTLTADSKETLLGVKYMIV